MSYVERTVWASYNLVILSLAWAESSLTHTNQYHYQRLRTRKTTNDDDGCLTVIQAQSVWRKCCTIFGLFSMGYASYHTRESFFLSLSLLNWLYMYVDYSIEVSLSHHLFLSPSLRNLSIRICASAIDPSLAEAVLFSYRFFVVLSLCVLRFLTSDSLPLSLILRISISGSYIFVPYW